jgi:hypothetical protein
MGIAFNCACGNQFRIENNGAGDHVRCPICGLVLAVPGHGNAVHRAVPTAPAPAQEPMRWKARARGFAVEEEEDLADNPVRQGVTTVEPIDELPLEELLLQCTLKSLASGVPQDALEQDLLRQGAAPATVKFLLKEAYRLKARAIRKKGLKKIAFGLGVILFGLVIGIIFFALFPKIRVSVGPVLLAGLALLCSGLFQWITGKNDITLW